MAFDDPGVVTGLELAALEGRRLQASLLVHDADALAARAGVLHGLGVSVAGLTVSVAAGSAVLSPGAGSNGSYLVVNAAQVDLTAVAQHATLARIDRVIVRVYDTEVDGSGFSKAEVQIVAGTVSASPVAPALPAGAFEVTQLPVPATGSPIVVVDKRSYTASVGGVITVATTADLPTGSFLRPGQPAFTTNYGVRWVWSGTRWCPINPLFANTTARDAAITSPAGGDVCRVGTASAWIVHVYRTAWVPLDVPANTSYFTPIAGVTHYASSGWAGLTIEVRGDTVFLNGALGGSAWAAGWEIGTINVDAYRPAAQVRGLGCIVKTDGKFQVDAATNPNSWSASWPLKRA